jgi:hypothetical protein
MKKLLFYFLLAIGLASCTKQNETPATPLNETIPPDTTAGNSNTPKYTGSFIKGPYGTVTGMANIYLANGKYTLALENISVTNGPDLHVYLSKEMQPINFIDLGKLKSTSGNQLYEIPGTPDFKEYTFALVHCQLYNHLFGSALLQ